MEAQTSEGILHAAKTIGDCLSIGVMVGTIISYLPAIAALFTILWTAIRIYETATIKKLLRKRKR